MPLRPTAIRRSRHVLAMGFIRAYFKENLCSPSFSEIGSEIGISTKHVGRLVRELVEARRIAFTPGKPRSIVPANLYDVFEDDIRTQLRRSVLIELFSMGFYVNEGKLVSPPNVTSCGVSFDALIADIDRAAEGAIDGSDKVEEDPTG